MGNRAGAFLGGLVLGTAVGTAIGLLVAPRSGRDTRRFLKKTAQALPDVAQDLKTSVQYQTEKLLDSAQHSLDDTFDRLQDAVAVGKETMLQKQKELKKQALSLEDDAPFQPQIAAAEGDRESASPSSPSVAP
ncbi:YtxH domain-containing protein [Synechococcus sp. PCC 7336]|uniref:YtxH domain-containing protein n=1 Tax=Synechococcus sp. PCC 7336 TaxID=195250 RepID=UPI000346BA72|nr:YtxH domain-containing protein [Synechococcus sp. PCC 7336]